MNIKNDLLHAFIPLITFHESFSNCEYKCCYFQKMCIFSMIEYMKIYFIWWSLFFFSICNVILVLWWNSKLLSRKCQLVLNLTNKIPCRKFKIWSRTDGMIFYCASVVWRINLITKQHFHFKSTIYSHSYKWISTAL